MRLTGKQNPDQIAGHPSHEQPVRESEDHAEGKGSSISRENQQRVLQDGTHGTRTSENQARSPRQKPKDITPFVPEELSDDSGWSAIHGDMVKEKSQGSQENMEMKETKETLKQITEAEAMGMMMNRLSSLEGVTQHLAQHLSPSQEPSMPRSLDHQEDSKHVRTTFQKGQQQLETGVIQERQVCVRLFCLLDQRTYTWRYMDGLGHGRLTLRLRKVLKSRLGNVRNMKLRNLGKPNKKRLIPMLNMLPWTL